MGGNEKGQSRANKYTHSPEKLQRLLEEAFRKARGKKKGPITQLWADLMAMLRMVQAYIRGEYRVLPWESLVLAIAAIAYFVSPIDFLPGCLDDALVIAFVIRAIRADLDSFLEWELRGLEGKETLCPNI